MYSFDKELSMLLKEMRENNVPIQTQLKILKRYSIKLSRLQDKLYDNLVVGTFTSALGAGMSFSYPIIGIPFIFLGVTGTLVVSKYDIENFEKKVKNKKY